MHECVCTHADVWLALSLGVPAVGSRSSIACHCRGSRWGGGARGSRKPCNVGGSRSTVKGSPLSCIALYAFLLCISSRHAAANGNSIHRKYYGPCPPRVKHLRVMPIDVSTAIQQCHRGSKAHLKKRAIGWTKQPLRKLCGRNTVVWAIKISTAVGVVVGTQASEIRLCCTT